MKKILFIALSGYSQETVYETSFDSGLDSTKDIGRFNPYVIDERLRYYLLSKGVVYEK
jgi:hypothetical protein